MEKWENSGLVIQWFFGILFFIFLLVFLMVLLVRENFRKIEYAKIEEEKMKLLHQKSLMETNIIVQEKERTRIAADIHDELIGKLAVIQLKNKTGDLENEVNGLLKHAINIARKISHDLSLPMIEYMPLNELIENIIIPWRRHYNVNYIQDIHDDVSLSYNVKAQLTRVVQELLVNINKHSGAGNIFIHLRQTNKRLSLIVADDGTGFDVKANENGLGQKNIEFRIDQINGRYKVRSGKSRGTSYIFLADINSIEHERN